MTVKTLLDQVYISKYIYTFDTCFNAYNAICDASKSIHDIVSKYLQNDIDWEDIFITKIGWNHTTDSIADLAKQFDDFDMDKFQSSLDVHQIEGADDNNKAILYVKYNK